MTEEIKLMRRFSGHMRTDRGGIMFYEILDGETVIGSMSTFTPRGKHAIKHPQKTTFMLRDRAFDTAAAFKKAYEEEKAHGRQNEN